MVDVVADIELVPFQESGFQELPRRRVHKANSNSHSSIDKSIAREIR